MSSCVCRPTWQTEAAVRSKSRDPDGELQKHTIERWNELTVSLCVQDEVRTLARLSNTILND